MSENSPIVLFEEIACVNTEIFEQNVNLQEMLGEIKDILSLWTPEKILPFINKYLPESMVHNENYIKSFSFSTINLIQVVLLEQNCTLNSVLGERGNVWDKMDKFDTIVDIRQWLYNVFKACIEHLVNSQSIGYTHIVEDIKKIIHERYNERLSVENIAYLVNFSPSHANNIFKSITGQTIFDYQTDYRMEKAKEFLNDPYTKVYLIAEMVGYTNKSHFSLQFKKHTGLTPMEFKNRTSK